MPESKGRRGCPESVPEWVHGVGFARNGHGLRGCVPESVPVPVGDVGAGIGAGVAVF